MRRVLRFIIVSPKKFLLMLAGLTMSGLIIAIVSSLIGSVLLGNGYAGWGGLVGAIAGMVIGYPLGVVIGLIIVNLSIKYQGSLLYGLIGVVFPATLVITLSEALNLNANPNVIFGAFFFAVPVIATLGYHLQLGR
jgi:hypothetical protein